MFEISNIQNMSAHTRPGTHLQGELLDTETNERGYARWSVGHQSQIEVRAADGSMVGIIDASNADCYPEYDQLLAAFLAASQSMQWSAA